MRIRDGIAAIAALGTAAGGILLGGATGAEAAGQTLPAHFAAPYLQIDGNTANDMAADRNATGLNHYTLAFLIPRSGCTPYWEASGDGIGAYTSQINALKAAGGDVIISSGGAEGGELAETCTSVSSLTAAYANIVDTYGVTRLDFDIEGGTLDDTAANQRRNQALAALQQQDPSVQVSYTLAVNPDGLPGKQYDLLTDAKNKGVDVSAVNIMTMDFGDGQNALDDALSATRGTASQLAGLYSVSTSAAYGRIGVTPIAGQNDDNEYFSQSDAQTLETFAAGNGVQYLSFWEVDQYDKPTGYAYSRIFNKLSGGGGTTPPPSGATGRITGYGGKCVDVAGANASNGSAVQLYDCNGTGAQSWTVASDGTLQALGKCMDVTAAGTANGAQVQLYDCNGSGAQVWRHQANGELVNPASGKCLDATGPSSANGTRLQIWTCYGSANQQWNLPS
ncbi:chitinase [Streptomyces montanisoli]|uniref:Ricin-type beta-trefoil lectin domain protein n=1 Tax=Streptomyces montanisoli TaxID=2798581 RepID=A0A940RX78_9ACTN|nr:chitinase [Streptomyces montanisoli]MBP0460041.1 ricin-type beta-trefoil lectin domain protein [Streptomyces montanisoli]